ncbi:MAG: hypothetical protein A2W00_10885 [Candidatus Eisenbacteria bacterium RBG_16_71_46]|nr:MAG: hypothetical protein A2W00_10885 [Candidatus Eisenbacteria bacterium RBG_16_71_46]
MSVVLAESGHAIGGTERVVWELATRLPGHRFEVRVWLSESPGVNDLAAALEDKGVPVDRVPEVDSRWDWRGLLDTWRRLRRARPRLLHVHHVWPAADRYLTGLAELAAIPHLVITEHIEGRSHSPAQRALKRRELARADAVTAVCGAVADSLVRDYGVDRARLRVVGNGADLPDAAESEAARLLRVELGAGPQRPLWVCAARLEEQKGHAVLLDALADLARRGQDFRMALAGEGARRAALEARAAELGLDGRVRFLGQVDEIGPLLACADAIVMPSLWEGLPLTLLEALVRARPLVASAVGGIPEVVTHGESGWLVPAGDPVAIADALETLHRRPDLALQLGREGARRVREDYTWPRVVERFEAVYDEVLGLASFVPASGARRGRAT